MSCDAVDVITVVVVVVVDLVVLVVAPAATDSTDVAVARAERGRSSGCGNANRAAKREDGVLRRWGGGERATRADCEAAALGKIQTFETHSLRGGEPVVARVAPLLLVHLIPRG